MKTKKFEPYFGSYKIPMCDVKMLRKCCCRHVDAQLGVSIVGHATMISSCLINPRRAFEIIANVAV